jgi:hypothetical protein
VTDPTTTDTEHVLTARDTRALRHADAITFDKTSIRAILRAENSGTGFEQTHIIPVVATVDNYHGSHDDYACFFMFLHAKYDHQAQTLIRRLRVGKRVRLQWVANNQSPVLNRAGLVRDELRLRVGDDTSAETYLVGVQVGENNLTRMVRGL